MGTAVSVRQSFSAGQVKLVLECHELRLVSVDESTQSTPFGRDIQIELYTV